MPADKIHLSNAKENKLFYFVANVVIYRDSDKRCLILKRSKEEKAHPSKYCVPGGKLEWDNLPIDNPSRINGEILDFENSVENLLTREVKEESNIKIHPEIKYLNSVSFIRADGIPVVLVKFAAKYKSGSVVLEKGAFTHHAWVNENEVENYDCIKGMKEEIKQTINLFKDNNS